MSPGTTLPRACLYTLSQNNSLTARCRDAFADVYTYAQCLIAEGPEFGLVDFTKYRPEYFPIPLRQIMVLGGYRKKSLMHDRVKERPTLLHAYYPNPLYKGFNIGIAAYWRATIDACAEESFRLIGPPMEMKKKKQRKFV